MAQRLKIDTITGINTPKIRAKLALALGCSEQTVRRYLKDNSRELTTADALAVIKEELSNNDILEEYETGSNAAKLAPAEA